jgi:Tol biopolymer transport system component
MGPDGSHLTPLTDNPGYDGFFSLSPDGEKIIYLSSSGKDPNTANLAIMNADGSNKVKLTDAGSFIFLGWSPDGQTIVYLQQTSENPEDDEIHVSDIDGKNHYQWSAITDEIKWEDEQHFIGYGWSGQSESPRWTLYRFSSSGTPPVEISSHSSPIVALYDHTYTVEGGSLLAWYGIDGNPAPLQSWDVRGDCKQRGDQYLQETSQAISPDGQYAFITVYCNDGYLQFYFANADGSEFKQLTDLSIETSINYRGVWSLDGKFVMIPITNKNGTTTDFYLFDIEAMLRDSSAQPLQLTTDGAAKDEIVWQPNP